MGDKNVICLQEPFLGKFRRDAMTDTVLREQEAGCEQENRKAYQGRKQRLKAPPCQELHLALFIHGHALSSWYHPLEVKGHHLQSEKRKLDSLKNQLVKGQGGTQN